MSSLQKSQTSYQQDCKRLLQEPEIRFAGVINPMGHLIAGGMKEGLTPLEDEGDRRKMYMELVLRVTTYSASRREHIVVLSFPLDNMVLMVSAQPDVDFDQTAKKVMKILNF